MTCYSQANIIDNNRFYYVEMMGIPACMPDGM